MQDQMQNITLKTVGGWANLAFCFWPIVISANCISLSPLAFGRRSGAESADRRTRARPSSIAGMEAAAAAANVIARRETPPFLAPPEVRGFLAHWREGTGFFVLLTRLDEGIQCPREETSEGIDLERCQKERVLRIPPKDISLALEGNFWFFLVRLIRGAPRKTKKTKGVKNRNTAIRGGNKIIN